MKIEITSYRHGLSDKIRLNLTRDIINNSTADLLLFSGHTIGFVNDIETLKTQINNTQIDVILELQNINTDKINNCLYRVTKGKLISLYTNQIFTQSSDIEANYELAARLLHEFENNRIIKINGTSILIIQCGEINILKNIQSENTILVFIHTNGHRHDLAQYYQSMVVKLPYPTSSSIELAKFANQALEKIFKKGYFYKKAGLIVMDFIQENQTQLKIFENSNPKHVPLMQTIDLINASFGQQKVKLASQDPKRLWKMRQEKLSPRYTTNLNEIITINV